MSTDAVISAEKSWSAALTAGDLTRLQAIAGDDLTYSHSTGTQDTKASYIEKLRSGSLKYTAFTYDPNLAVRLFGTVAVLTGSAQVSSISDGKASSSHLQLMHVFVNRKGTWQLVAHQSTKLPK